MPPRRRSTLPATQAPSTPHRQPSPNGIITPASSTTPTARAKRSTRTLGKTNSGLTPSSTINGDEEGSVSHVSGTEEDELDLDAMDVDDVEDVDVDVKGSQGSRKKVVVEIPMRSRRSARGSQSSGKKVVVDSDEEDEGEETEMEDVKKPANKNGAPAGKKRKVADLSDSDFDSDVKPLLKKPHPAKPTPSTRSSRSNTASSKPSKPAQSSSGTKGKAKVLSDSEDLDQLASDLDGEEEEDEQAYLEFAGDDSELDSERDLKVGRNRKIRGAVESPAKGKGKAKAKATTKAPVRGKGKGKGKMVKDEEEDVIDVDALSDMDPEEYLLQEAIKASLQEGGKSTRSGRSAVAASGKDKGARSREAEKRARAAERRLGLRDDSESEFQLSDNSLTRRSSAFSAESDLSADDSDFDGSSTGGGFIKSKSKSASKGKNKIIPTKYQTEEEKFMDLAKMKQKRREHNAKKKEENAPIQKQQKELMKKLKRKLTQGEKNGIALAYHHPELQDVWGDLQARVKPVKPTTMEAHPSLKLTLLPFQKESLFWMKEQEKGPWRGGMLADEMGMGKTIQTIALLLSEPRRKPSLVVAPVVALMQWKHEIETHAEGFTVCLWHGSGRTKAEELKKFDVVLVSYGTLEAAFRKQQKGFKRGKVLVKEKSPMHAFQWHRIILDEAHNIKERSTNAAKAAFALDAQYRWCLSGTPLQNRVGELYSLVRFLGGDPFAFYYCKKCPCKSLHWQFTDKRTCDDCGHSPMVHTCYWNNEILTPIQKYGMSGAGGDAFKKLKILLDRMMLRRTKIERADDLGLPPRTITIRRGFFSPEEKELYVSLFSETRRQFSTYIAEGTILNNYSNVFSLITRMRQMACHPDLVLRSKTSKYVQTSEEVVCRLCHDAAEDAIVSKCNHLFDRECIRQYIEGHARHDIPACPVCHLELTIDLEGEAVETGEEKKMKKQGILGRLNLDEWRSSTKLEMLVDELTEIQQKDYNIKSLVFSQFVSMLDLAAFRLQRAGFKICRLEGGMTPQARDATIQHFMKNPGVTVFLISLKAGGVALNLTEASKVFLLDSWWNPSVEYQAMDRIHRLGQHRPVEVIKLVVEDSIESKIVQLQEKKLAMTEAALATDPDSALGKLTEDDLQFLFRL